MWHKNEAFIFIVVFFSRANSLIDPEIISRDQWKAREPESIQKMENPVPYVVIHHSYMPAACYNLEDCIGAMQWIQNLHQLKNGWVDIGYSFAVGSDGRAYEGRGWSRIGAHAPHFNNKSIGICVIGDWRDSLPPEEQLAAVQQLIRMGVRDGKIARDYRLVGHKQVRYGTLCPGSKLHDEIKSWPNYYNCSPETVPELKGTLPIGATPIDATPNSFTPTETMSNEATPIDTMPSKATPTETMSSEATPIDTMPSKATPTETMSSVATPIEAMPNKATPTETMYSEATPIDTMPSKATPTETMSSEATPIEAMPSENTPTETMSSEATPIEAMPSEDTPTETTPSETSSSEGTPSEDGNDENRLRKRAPSFS